MSWLGAFGHPVFLLRAQPCWSLCFVVKFSLVKLIQCYVLFNYYTTIATTIAAQRF